MVNPVLRPYFLPVGRDALRFPLLEEDHDDQKVMMASKDISSSP